MEGHAGTYVFIVLVAPLKVFYVCCQMGVDDAEASVVENKPHCYASFVPLQKNNKNNINTEIRIKAKQNECLICADLDPFTEL